MIRIRRWLRRHNPLATWHAHTLDDGRAFRLVGHRHTVLVLHRGDLAAAHPDLAR